MNLVLCSDSACPKKDKCSRFVTNPLSEILARRKTRVEPTLKNVNEEECSKFRTAALHLIKITT